MTEEELKCLYLNNYKRQSFQWELWAECNNHCKYCYLGPENEHTSPERKLLSINNCIDHINKLDFNNWNNISLIGGEFFQGQLSTPELHDRFMDLIELIAKLYSDKKIGSVWLTTTMTIGDQKDLYEALDIFKKYDCVPNETYTSSGIWVCTSWDSDGRFHSQKMKDAWEYHMLNIHEKYPFIKFNTTTILTGYFIDEYMSGEFNYVDFQNKFNTTMFFKQPGLGCRIPISYGDDTTYEDYSKMWMNIKGQLKPYYGEDFFPTRKKFITFLQEVIRRNPEMYDKIYNIKYRADVLERNFNEDTEEKYTPRDKDSKKEDASAKENKCGHIFTYACYSDNNKCCLCDKLMVEKSM